MQAEKKIKFNYGSTMFAIKIKLWFVTINLSFDFGYLLVAIKYEVWANSFEALTS